MLLLKSYRDPRNPDKPVQIDQPHVSDELYAQVVRSFPIPTVDITLTATEGKVLYLARRKVYPAPEPWIIGGRIYFNDETIEDAVIRVMERETGMIVDPQRLTFVSIAYYSWLQIAQACPGKTISFNFKMDITEAERDSIAQHLVPSEYDVEYGLQSFDRSRLVRENCHPAIIDLFDEILLKKSSP